MFLNGWVLPIICIKVISAQKKKGAHSIKNVLKRPRVKPILVELKLGMRKLSEARPSWVELSIGKIKTKWGKPNTHSPV